ncbi:MAG: hypothetical protein ACRDOS_13330 [Gaiellaceae bacterium]
MLHLEPPSPPLDDGAVRLEPLTLIDVDDMGALADDPEVARITYVPVPLPEDFGRQCSAPCT